MCVCVKCAAVLKRLAVVSGVVVVGMLFDVHTRAFAESRNASLQTRCILHYVRCFAPGADECPDESIADDEQQSACVRCGKAPVSGCSNTLPLCIGRRRSST